MEVLRSQREKIIAMTMSRQILQISVNDRLAREADEQKDEEKLYASLTEKMTFVESLKGVMKKSDAFADDLKVHATSTVDILNFERFAPLSKTKHAYHKKMAWSS